ncbi:MAG: hypothetical protein OEU26_16995 [Candidatus Tectomicrobia bacterium]|nr:hypothetical protein [Candidatus Tectomicrobia bacterium]
MSDTGPDQPLTSIIMGNLFENEFCAYLRQKFLVNAIDVFEHPVRDTTLSLERTHDEGEYGVKPTV